MKPNIKIKFVDFWTHSKLVQSRLIRILSQKFTIEISEEPDFLIYSCFGKTFLKYDCIRIFYTGENKRPNFKQCDYAFSFDYPISGKNYRLPIYRLNVENFEQLNQLPRATTEMKNRERKFCNFVYSNNKAKERKAFFQQLQQYKQVDSGGKVLNNLGYRVDDKIDFLRQYKFTIAFENTSYPGYTTEKLLHPLIANSIPIYWGNPLASRDFNPDAFINCHDFNNFDEVIKRVIEIDNNDDLYQAYLEAPIFSEAVDNEYLNDENISNRFESIFLNRDIKPVAKKIDLFWFYLYDARRRGIKLVKKFLP